MAHRAQFQCAVLIVCCLAAASAFGHGAGFQRDSAQAMVLRFGYSTGEPMSDTDVVVHGPDQSIALRTRTDRDGRVAFVPTTPGEWQAQIDDGLGHEVAAKVLVDDDGAVSMRGEAQRVAVPQTLLLLLLAASVLGNVVQAFRRRSSSSK